ncbi:DUF1918 domain-containing protein [Streptomyces flavidovirens]|uniref:DUF1918 domain-containing protein n=1 Tax=Streptomyces flavidovirens TaxID=67298 RepID=UPI0036CF7B0E
MDCADEREALYHRRQEKTQAAVGDYLTFHPRVPGSDPKSGEIIEVLGEDGAPPYWVRFPDGQEAKVDPEGQDVTLDRRDGS